MGMYNSLELRVPFCDYRLVEYVWNIPCLLYTSNKAVLEFEKTRVVRDLRNNVNRIVNCETANLNKVVQTSVRQIENIKLIKKKHKFNNLTEKEKELANLRLKNPNATLTELGKMLKKPIGKSGEMCTRDSTRTS